MGVLYGDASRGGEWAAVALEVEGQRIRRADAPGLDRDLAGLTLLDAAAVGGETLAVDALANAIGPAVRGDPDAGRTAVAMSGGVDSAVALLDAGPGAVGVTLRLWIDPAASRSERACCSPEAVVRARETCHRLGLPHVTLDLREAFRRSVVAPFVAAYARGDTPNPCTRCNGSFRFDELWRFARRLGAARLATGHYARIVERCGRPALARGLDASKDQSYMLATLAPAALRGLWFPLGEETKARTRARAARAGLAAAAAPESQEACFLGGDDYRDFLVRHGLVPRRGPLLDEAGHQVGEHDGFWRFTPGQRRGLGVGGGEPLYALDTRPASNAVVVGPRGSLARSRVSVTGRLDEIAGPVAVKLRHRSPLLPAAVEPTATGFDIALASPALGVARGQTAVVYEGDVVVGAGIVTGAG